MASRRTKRLGALIQAELAGLLLRKVKDPRLQGISITEVDVSPDMKQAKVYFSPLDPDRRGDAEKGLKAAAPFLRSQLAANLHLKSTPRLTPVYDSSLVEGDRMERLIREVRDRDKESSGPDEPEEQ